MSGRRATADRAHALIPLFGLVIAACGCADASRSAEGAAQATPPPAPVHPVEAGPPASPHAAAAPLTRTIELQTALQLAAKGHFDILEAELRLAAAAGRSSAAAGGLLPTLGLGGVMSRTAGQAQSAFGQLQLVNFRTVGDLEVVSLSLNAGESVYRDLASRQAYQAETHVSEAVALRIIAAVTQRYLNLLESEMTVRIQEHSLADATSLVHLTEIREGQGTGSALDTARARTQQAATEQRLNGFRNDRQRRSKELAEDLRLDGLIDLIPVEQQITPATLIDPAEPMDAWLQRAQRNRPELWALADAQLAAKRDASAARWSAWGPSVVLAAGYGQLGTTIGNLEEREGWSVGLNWTLSGAAFGRIDEADARASSAGLTTQRFSEHLRIVVETAFREVQLYRDQLEPSQRELDSAELALRIANARFNGGVLPATDLLLAQQAADDARIRRVATIVRYNQAQTRLLAEAGLGTVDALGRISPAGPTAPSGPAAAPK